MHKAKARAMVYVLFGGMTATTWEQIIKACLLLCGGTFMAIMVLAQFGFSPEALFAKGVAVKSAITEAGGKTPEEAAKAGLSIMGPGGFIKDPISAISFGMALMFGTAGLPHVLMRFFTVPDAKEARKSVFWATTWVGYFFILIFIIGFGAITLVLTNPELADTAKSVIKGGAGTANMAAVLVAKTVGGDVFYGFISAVAFATILAVVAGLTLSGASAVSHDLYSTVFKKGNADSASELRVSHITTLALGVIAVGLGIAFEKKNIAFMVSPAVWEVTLGIPKGSAWFQYSSTALFSMTIGFVGIWLFSVLDKSEQAKKERAAFPAQQVRSETGYGAAAASDH